MNSCKFSVFSIYSQGFPDADNYCGFLSASSTLRRDRWINTECANNKEDNAHGDASNHDSNEDVAYQRVPTIRGIYFFSTHANHVFSVRVLE